MYFNNEPTKESNETINISLSNRQASLFIAAGLLIIFFSFITGYFWGKRNAISQFCMSVEQSSFADRIYTSMCELSETEAPTTQETVAAAEEQAVAQVTSIDAVEATEEQEDLGVSLNHDSVQHVVQAVVETPTKSESMVPYHAQLVGYGSQQMAEKFAQKLRKKGMPVKVEAKKSKSTKGKTRSWYQVVTQDFTSKNELEALVARISKEEKLSGVRITRS